MGKIAKIILPIAAVAAGAYFLGPAALGGSSGLAGNALGAAATEAGFGFGGPAAFVGQGLGGVGSAATAAATEAGFGFGGPAQFLGQGVTPISGGGIGNIFTGIGQGLKSFNTGITEATGGLFSGGDLLKTGIGALAGGAAGSPVPININLPDGGAAVLPGSVRPDVRTTGLTRTDQLGNPVSFGVGDDLQNATNIFTAINSGAGGLNLPPGDASDPRNLQFARQSLFNLGVDAGGAINPGFQFPQSGFQALKRLGKPAQQQTAAGGFSALRELIEQQQQA